MGNPVIQRSFAAGELAPVLQARADQAKYTMGLRTCKNFLVRREGGVTTRPGFRYVDNCRTSSPGTRLMRYIDATPGQSVLIEIGDHALRIFKDGGLVEATGVTPYNAATNYQPGDLASSGGVNYYCTTANTNVAPPNAAFWYAMPGSTFEIPTPYPVTDRFKWNQSGNVITLTHHSHAPMELIFEALTHWVLRTVSTAAALSKPTGLVATAGTAGALPYSYVVTSLATDGFEESPPSDPVACACAAPTTAAPNGITWTADPNAAEYNVYLDPYGNGVYGFVGKATAASFKDAGLVPDFTETPPSNRTLFASADNYPETSAVFQQRRFFGNTNTNPDAIDGSRIGFPSNFNISSPLQDDDAVSFKIAGNNHHAVRFMLALRAGLILMTDGGEWTVNGVQGGFLGPITPSSIVADQNTYVGVSASVRPVIVGSAVLYLQARGSIVRELKFDQQIEGLGGRDLTIWATHLLEGHTVVSMDYQQVPDSIIWCVRSDGVLLGLTYIPEQDVWGWHQHTTGASGIVEDVCVVPELTEDVVYLIVRRIINNLEVRFVEKLETRQIVNFNQQAFFVDAGLSYSGAGASSFSNLDHLEGQTVAILGDGAVVFNGDPTAANAGDFVVTGGEVILDATYKDVHIGIPIQYADFETLDLDVQGSEIRDKLKAVHAVTVLVEKSARSFLVGPDASNLTPYVPQVYELNVAQTTGQLELNITTSFDHYGRVFIRQPDPLPLTILGVVPNVELGG
jgi:hypothetical protein